MYTYVRTYDTLMTDCIYFSHFALYDIAFKFNRMLHEPYLCDWFIIDFFFFLSPSDASGGYSRF